MTKHNEEKDFIVEHIFKFLLIKPWLMLQILCMLTCSGCTWMNNTKS